MTFLRKAVNKWNEMKHLFLGQTKIKTRNVVIAKLRKNYSTFPQDVQKPQLFQGSFKYLYKISLSEQISILYEIIDLQYCVNSYV